MSGDEIVGDAAADVVVADWTNNAEVTAVNQKYDYGAMDNYTPTNDPICGCRVSPYGYYHCHVQRHKCRCDYVARNGDIKCMAEKHGCTCRYRTCYKIKTGDCKATTHSCICSLLESHKELNYLEHLGCLVHTGRGIKSAMKR